MGPRDGMIVRDLKNFNYILSANLEKGPPLKFHCQRFSLMLQMFRSRLLVRTEPCRLFLRRDVAVERANRFFSPGA